ncbi:hypothetical protein J4402_05590 [Candidatus Pacearchaeota archaeon]|nr:hypothetical protein [Candidatus Pacearchaeota archaeon]
MKKEISRKEAKEQIDIFFGKEKFSEKEVKKIKTLAMKFNIKLSEYRKKFCKKCLTKLNGKIRIGRNYKTVECGHCRYRNRFKMN